LFVETNSSTIAASDTWYKYLKQTESVLCFVRRTHV